MSTLRIDNALLIVTMDDSDREFPGGHIYIEDGRIRSIGAETSAQPAEEVIDAKGMVVLPGFINTHHHLFQSLTRCIPRMQNAPLFDWLRQHYEIWRELSASGVKTSAATALLELMKSGVTTSSDHLYLFPKQAEANLIDSEIEAARLLGIRFQPTRGFMIVGTSEGGLAPNEITQNESEVFADCERLLEQYHDSSEGSMLRISLAPCSPFSITGEQMRRTAKFAAKHALQMHTHLAETLDEEQYCLDHYGQRPVEYARTSGWLAPNAWFAHAIHLNDEELRLMGDVHCGVAHCPASNMRLGSGIARIKEMLEAGVNVSLGVDGSASNDSGNFIAEARNALQLSRLREQSCWLSAREVLRMATRGGAAALGRSDIGSLEVGKHADLALFDVTGIEYAGAQSDPVAALIFCVRTTPVTYLIVNGTIQIRAGKSMQDESLLAKQHNEFAEDILKTAERRTGIRFREPVP